MHDQLLDVRGVADLLGVSRSQIYRLLESDTRFPRPLSLGVRAVRWRPDDLTAWINQLAADRDAEADRRRRGW